MLEEAWFIDAWKHSNLDLPLLCFGENRARNELPAGALCCKRLSNVGQMMEQTRLLVVLWRFFCQKMQYVKMQNERE
jgi:hypothetical protein